MDPLKYQKEEDATVSAELGQTRVYDTTMFWHRYKSWAFPALLSLLLVLLTSPISVPIGASNSLFQRADPPRKSDNLTDVVQWDNYTLFLNDQRIFLQYALSQFRHIRIK